MIEDEGRKHSSQSREEDEVQKDAVGSENRRRDRTPSATEEAATKKEDHIPERGDLSKTRGEKFKAK
jgi:hypothetical protein